MLIKLCKLFVLFRTIFLPDFEFDRVYVRQTRILLDNDHYLPFLLGANDVSMIQMADVGVGICGQEGRQAVMASDFAMGQFRFLKRLLLVHGHWNYQRVGYLVLYNFYRNAVFVMMLFWYFFYSDSFSILLYLIWFILKEFPYLSLSGLVTLLDVFSCLLNFADFAGIYCTQLFRQHLPLQTGAVFFTRLYILQFQPLLLVFWIKI